MRARGTMRLRKFVKDLLEKNEEMTTGEILDAYNQSSKYGTTMHILGNVLNQEATKVGYIESIGRSRVRNALWSSKGE
jgi:hypothetical protein